MSRIILTGAQGTGKTTILNHYKNQQYNIITEVVRNLAKKGVPINENGTYEGQNIIFQEYKRLLSSKEDYMSDRGLTDVFGYSLYLQYINPWDCSVNKLVEHQKVELVDFLSKNPDVIFCYFPIEFPVENDGVRSVDEEYRKLIDRNIKFILDELSIPYYTISGELDKRLAQMNSIIHAHK